MEGGNLAYKTEGGEEVRSEPTNLDERHEAIHHISKLIHGIRGAVGAPNNHPAHEYAVGSTKHFLDPSVKNEDFARVGKKSFGDMDILVPDTEEVKDKLEKHLVPGVTHGNHTLEFAKSSGTGHYTIWKNNDTGKRIQLDVDRAPHDKNGLPTAGSSWMKSSPKEDLFPSESGAPSIKGVFHKYATRALTSALAKPVMTRGTKNELKQSVAKYNFAVGYGLRPATQDTGEVHENGLPIHRNLPSAGASYITEPREMIGAILGKKPTEEDAADFGSMRGIHRIVKRHLTPEQQTTYVDKHIGLLYGKGSQAISDHLQEGGREADNKVKDTAIEELRRSFPAHFTPEKESEIKQMRQEFNENELTRPRRPRK